MPQTAGTHRPPSTMERATGRGVRATQAATERRRALIALCVVAVVAILGVATYARAQSARVSTSGSGVASHAGARVYLVCPYNGCMARACHPKTKAVHGAGPLAASSVRGGVGTAASGE